MAKEKFNRNKKLQKIGDIKVKNSNRDKIKELNFCFERVLIHYPDSPIANWPDYEKIDTMSNQRQSI